MAPARAGANLGDGGEPEVSFTTPELVRDYARSTGLTPAQVMQLVARCALVKHLAKEYGNRFILKGGALLYHVYGTNRVSLLDTDYAEVETKGVPNPDELEREIIFSDPAGYSLKTTPNGRWTERGNMVRANNLTFTLETFQPGREAGSRVNISVSFRKSERRDIPKEQLTFKPDGLLTDSAPFPVSGLTLTEAAAEKILAWCLKEETVKHFGDLALLARDHQSQINRERAIELVAEKFESEKRAPETRGLYEGLDSPADLIPLFLDKERLANLRATWTDGIGTRIWLRPDERRLPRSIIDVENVETLVRESWAEAIEQLSGYR
jgi:hypothetical protein